MTISLLEVRMPEAGTNADLRRSFFAGAVINGLPVVIYNNRGGRRCLLDDGSEAHKATNCIGIYHDASLLGKADYAVNENGYQRGFRFGIDFPEVSYDENPSAEHYLPIFQSLEEQFERIQEAIGHYNRQYELLQAEGRENGPACGCSKGPDPRG